MLHAAHAPTGERAFRRPSLEVADIVRAFGEDFARAHPLSPQQAAVLRDIARCRTAALGGHQDICAACGHVQSPSYNSCRNRHCPKCQSLSQARWVEQRMTRMLPTHAFHVVFTLPRPLRRLALVNPGLVFDALFAAAAASLLELGRAPRRLGADLGVTTVLHTWTRDLRFHPHVHCIVTGGGLSLDSQRWVAAPTHYLFPVRVLSELFVSAARTPSFRPVPPGPRLHPRWSPPQPCAAPCSGGGIVSSPKGASSWAGSSRARVAVQYFGASSR